MIRHIASGLSMAFMLTSVAQAEPAYLQCRLSTVTVELHLSANESTGKIAQTYAGSTVSFTADAQFTPSHIHWLRKSASGQQTEKFSLDRKTLGIEHSIYLYGNANPTTSGIGSCHVLTKTATKV